MRENNLTVERHYQPDEDAMVSALMTILRSKSPPGEGNMMKNGKETVGNSLQAQPTVSPLTTRPDTGGTRV